MNKYISLLGIFAIACAGTDSATTEVADSGVEQVDASGQLGTAKQAYHSRVSGLYQHGTQTGSALRACDRSTTGQTCSVPKFKNFEICLGNTFSATEKSRMLEMAQGIDSRSNFTFSYPSDCSAAPLAGKMRLIIDPGVVSGSLSSNIQGYATVQLGSPSNLTEGVAGADPVGNFQTHGFCLAKIDLVDIYAKGANSTEDTRLLKHAGASVILKCQGNGSRQDVAAVPAYSRESIVLGSNLTVYMTDGEKCRADAYDTTANGDFSNTGAVCPTE